jgi:ankyrin repeat protein
MRLMNKQTRDEQEHAYSRKKFVGFETYIYHNREEVLWVFEEKKMKINRLTYELRDRPEGMTTLYRVCELNDVFIARLLFTIGTCDCNEYSTVELDNKQMGERNAFYFACMRGHDDIVKICLAEKTGRIDVTKGNNNALSPLQIAARNSKVSVMQLLMADPRTNVNAKDSIDATAIIESAARNCVEGMKLLLADKRVDVNCQNCDGWTPIIYAAYNGHMEVARLLLADSRVNHTIATYDGWIASQVAFSRGHRDMAIMLHYHRARD